MHAVKHERSIVPFAAAVLVMISLFSVATAGERVDRCRGSSISFSGAPVESYLDEDGDGKYEYLVLSVNITVYRPGSYGLYGTVEKTAVANTDPSPLGLGDHTLELRFSGADLTLIEKEGRFSIHLEIFSRDIGIEPEMLDSMTAGSLSPDLFEAPSTGQLTQVSIMGQDVVIKSSVIEVRVNRTTPRMSFSYSGEAAERSRATVTYERIVAFNDMDGDGVWNEGADELRYSAPLYDLDWRLGTDFSKGYGISLYGVVPLRMAGTSTAAAYAKVTFSFRSTGISPDGDMHKFDIEVELMQSLDAEYLSIVHKVADETGDLAIGVGGSMGGNPHSVTLSSGEDIFGIYSWNDDLAVGREELSGNATAVTSTVIGEGVAHVIFSYPLDNGTLRIYHDPNVGMDPENIPTPSGGEDFLRDRPLILVIGVVLGGGLVATTIIWRYMGRKGSRGSVERGEGGG